MVDLLCLQNTLLAYGAKDSVFLMSKHCVPHLGAARGAIVSIASTRALQSEPDTEAYAASKGGVVALTHALAVSLGTGRPRRAQCGHRPVGGRRLRHRPELRRRRRHDPQDDLPLTRSGSEPEFCCAYAQPEFGL
jgi:NAD(P)-dependent dehydrogenase (short-subunit alcohol dehydrogenase family)